MVSNDPKVLRIGRLSNDSKVLRVGRLSTDPKVLRVGRLSSGSKVLRIGSLCTDWSCSGAHGRCLDLSFFVLASNDAGGALAAPSNVALGYDG